MKPLKTHEGIVVPLDRANVDTDLIIPKQFLKSVKRSGFGPNLFDQLRYLDEGQPGMDPASRQINPDFILNEQRYSGASILLARENFGCGSSREHAPWALEDYGFRVLLAPSFADIFYNNCFKNGILPVTLPGEVIDGLFTAVTAQSGFRLKIDLENQEITTPDGTVYPFEIDPFRKHCLLEGLDDIGLTLQEREIIAAFEAKRKEMRPWLY